MFNMVMEQAFGKRLAIARTCLVTTLFLTLIGATQFASADDFSNGPVIFDVRRSLPLEPDEEVYHDFYIGAGSEAGFKKGMFVTVVRPLPIHDPIQNKQQATLNVTVARLQVIQVGKGITVGRLYSEMNNDERPTLEFEAVMIGDRVDLSSLTSEAPPKSQPKVSSKNKRKLSANDDSLELKVETVETAPAAAAAASVAIPAPAATSPAGTSAPLESSVPAPAVAPAPVPAIVPVKKIEVPVPAPSSASVPPRAV